VVSSKFHNFSLSLVMDGKKPKHTDYVPRGYRKARYSLEWKAASIRRELITCRLG